nr:hypothetical protein [uncultured Desulfuromonas sp.]
MVQKRHTDILRKKDNEDFRALRHSNFWEYLPNKTRHNILWMLGEDWEGYMQGENDF